jgi:alkaline phosphatase
LGLTQEVDNKGNLEEKPKADRNGKTFTTLNYANGVGYKKEGERPNLTQEQVTNPNYTQEAIIPLGSETHGGEDVAIFAIGVNAHLIRGSMEQNWIFYFMADALRLKK